MEPQFKKFVDQIQCDKKFSIEHLKYLIVEFDERFWRSLRNVATKNVKKYIFTPSNRTAWIVIGKNRDYLIISNLFCPCDDFYVKVVVQKSSKICYHLLSKILAEALDYYEVIAVEDERYNELMKDWKLL